VLNIGASEIILIAFFLGIGFPVHECAHAFAAYRLGDATAKLAGRLTLNPIAHFDPLGGLILVASVLLGGGFIIGWAKPTPVNPWNLVNRRNSEVIVALAGPFSNLVMALIGAFVFRIFLSVLDPSTTGDPVFIALQTLYLFVAFNVALAVFNLLPVPPLDGSSLLFRFLPPLTAARVRPLLSQFGFIGLLILILVGGRYIGALIYGVADLLVGF
jgi:Zn-dependent protease